MIDESDEDENELYQIFQTNEKDARRKSRKFMDFKW